MQHCVQDPVLFSGTLRSNLDNWGHHTDAQLWDVLSAVRLKPAISNAGGLAARMAECGDNLSVGQRQLFCLARYVLMLLPACSTLNLSLLCGCGSAQLVVFVPAFSWWSR